MYISNVQYLMETDFSRTYMYGGFELAYFWMRF